MTIKVIGAGFGRTGTLSLKHALEQLGFGKSHHMEEVVKSRTQTDYWSEIAQGKATDWPSVFEGFQSTTDFPACVYYRELAQEYPDAKLILSVRDEDSWYRSVEQTILPVSESIPKWLLALIPRARTMNDAVQRIVWQNTFDGRARDPEHAKAVFRTHNQTVIDSFPKERVLVFQAKDGWEPLCAFLEVDVPEGPYPHLNDTAEMLRRVKVLKALNWLPLVLAVVLVVTLFAVFS